MSKARVHRYLTGFWGMFKECSTEQQKLALLCVAADQFFLSPSIAKRKSLRKKFNKPRKKAGAFRQSNCCQVCGGTPQHRHHIVTLKNGGHNHPRNCIILCQGCHKKIHPWLAHISIDKSPKRDPIRWRVVTSALGHSYVDHSTLYSMMQRIMNEYAPPHSLNLFTFGAHLYTV